MVAGDDEFSAVYACVLLMTMICIAYLWEGDAGRGEEHVRGMHVYDGSAGESF